MKECVLPALKSVKTGVHIKPATILVAHRAYLVLRNVFGVVDTFNVTCLAVNLVNDFLASIHAVGSYGVVTSALEHVVSLVLTCVEGVTARTPSSRITREIKSPVFSCLKIVSMFLR